MNECDLIPNSPGACLALDCSSSALWLAVQSAKGQVWESHFESGPSHSEDLTANLEKLLAEAQTNASEITDLVVGAGPGSFTGLRIAFSFAKGFVFKRNVNLSLVSSHAAAAHEFLNTGKNILVMSPAGRSEYFVSCFNPTGQITTSPQILDSEALRTNWSNLGSAKVVVQLGPIDPSFSDLVPEQPKRLATGLIALKGGDRHTGTDIIGLSGLCPTYLRQVAAKTIAERAAGGLTRHIVKGLTID